MFTGIISDVGKVLSSEKRGDTRFRLASGYVPASIDIGASIACHGVCLTVVEKGAYENGAWFDVDASAETLSKTNLANWKSGTLVNLERALKVGDELGGHIVSGHIDGLGAIVSITPEGDSKRFVFSAPHDIAAFIAPKGSMTINGVSLTVNEVNDSANGTTFGVNIIPHTQKWSSFGRSNVGDAVNLEIDVLARYVSRLRSFA
jgi:riboflavin synthase